MLMIEDAITLAVEPTPLARPTPATAGSCGCSHAKRGRPNLPPWAERQDTQSPAGRRRTRVQAA